MKQIESFFWGIVAALGALVVQLVIYIAYLTYAGDSGQNLSFEKLFTIPAFIITGAAIEESFKYLIISKRIDMYSQVRSYIVNSLFVGLGFFATELALIFLSKSLIQTKSLTEIAIIHLGTAGIIGYIVATRNPKRVQTFLYALLIATIFHTSYNLLILQRTLITDWTVIFVLATLVFSNFINLIRIAGKLAQD